MHKEVTVDVLQFQQKKKNYGPEMYSLAENDRGVDSPNSGTNQHRLGSIEDDIYVPPMVLEKG